MRKQQQLHFTFDNPNSREAFENNLRHILLEKLLAEFTHRTDSFPYNQGGN